ncbi:phosphomannose isomerase type II C-terminal cupin domain [Patescibacteria group bacterium]|nr:phosphomannose isomerase type II C-terminal cupin domain [Patescibacteria group bacterium]
MTSQNKNLVNFYREKRPWGDFLEFIKNQEATVKILDVFPGEETSLQSHQKRDEFWYVIRGEAKVIVNSKERAVKAGDHIYIPKKEKHRLINYSPSPVVILEISFGEFAENDEKILEDKYHRKRGL